MKILKNKLFTTLVSVLFAVGLILGITFTCVDLSGKDVDAATTAYLYFQIETGYKTGVYTIDGSASQVEKVTVKDASTGSVYATGTGNAYSSISVSLSGDSYPNGLAYEVVTKSGYVVNTTKSGQLTLAGGAYRVNIYLDKSQAGPTNDTYWDEHTSELDTTWAGSGTESDPYKITSAAELAGLAYNVNNGVSTYSAKYFKQTVRIDVSKYWWKPIGYNKSGNISNNYFRGKYDGGGNIVEGIFTEANAEASQGLFGFIDAYDSTTIGSVIKNLGIENSIIQGSNSVGGLVGTTDGCVYIINCYNKATISGGTAGGLVGATYRTNARVYMQDCYNAGDITAVQSAGGLVGCGPILDIEHCYNIGKINSDTSSGFSGGLVGERAFTGSSSGGLQIKIKNSFNAGVLNGKIKGGILGCKSSGVSVTFSNCYYSNTCGATQAVGQYYNSAEGATQFTASSENVKSKSWYENGSNWDSIWDFDFNWTFKSGVNDDYPVLGAFYSTTLKINPNGGKFSGSTSTVYYVQHIGETRTLPVPTREGYTFKGWRAVGTSSGKINRLGKLVSNNKVFASKDNVSIYGSETTFTNEATTLHQSPYNTQVLKISITGACTNQSSNRKGFTFDTQTYADAEFIAIFEAKIPVGYKVHWCSNQCGGTNWDGVKSGWLTSQEGTGDWETYAHYVKCWPASTGGSYDGTNYFFFEGPAGTASNPVNVYLAQASVYDCTGMNLNTNTIMSNLTKDARYIYGTSNTILVAMWESDVWTRHAANSFAGGNGSASNPYQIANASQLAKLAKDSHSNNQYGVYYKQTANIDLSGHIWDGIGGQEHSLRFVGHFDGGYHTITNMKTSAGDYVQSYAGLLALTNLSGGSTIENVIIRNSQIEGIYAAGGITGNGATLIKNCIVEDTSVKARSGSAGGIIGDQYYNVMNCLFKNGSVQGGSRAGGIVGYWCQDAGQCIDNAVIGATITGINYSYIVAPTRTGCTTNSCYGQGTVNGTATKIMYGNSSAWGNWTYNSGINNGYPMQSGLFWIGGQSGSTNVYNYLKNTLGFSEG